jgi:hypothetical protein
MKLLAGLVLAVMMCAAPAVYACKPVHGQDYSRPDDKQKIARADVVFSGKVVSMRAAPIEPDPYANLNAWLYTFDVVRWEKGRHTARVVVTDGPGTDCDDLHFITHLHIAKDARLPSARWRIFAREGKNGRLHVINAEPRK